jgi:hypothetical protein
MSDRCLLYPQKQTLIEGVGMSALCQKQTFCALKKRVVIRRSSADYVITRRQCDFRATITRRFEFHRLNGLTALGVGRTMIALRMASIRHVEAS